MVIRGDGNVLGDEVVPGSREGVARLRCWSEGARVSVSSGRQGSPLSARWEALLCVSASVMSWSR